MPVVLGGYSQDVTNFGNRARQNIPGVKLDLTKVLDGERMIELYRPLPLESKAQVVAKGKTTGVYDSRRAVYNLQLCSMEGWWCVYACD